jgi:YXWGXW repeat-containing protein
MKNAVSSLILATTLFGAVEGCTVEAHGRVRAPPPPTATIEVEVEEEPPPPRRVVVETRPGFVFVEGRWYRRGGHWEWADGRWERERVGHVWVPGRWERRGRHHVWIEGSWRAGGGAVVRDHR